MRVMVTDFGVRHRALAQRLAGTGLEVRVAVPGEPVARVPAQAIPPGTVVANAAGPPFVLPEGKSGVTPRSGLTVAEVSPGDDPAHLRKLTGGQPGRPLLVVARAPVPELAQVEDLGITVMFPGFEESVSGGAPERSCRPLALPCTVVGPLVGRPRDVDRWVASVLLKAGIRASCRPDMQRWLTVTSAWLSPLRGALLAAAQQGLPLSATPDLITVATRAARQRLSLLRSCGFDLDARCACLVALPEWWAIKAMRRVAAVMPRDGDLWWLPTADEVMAVGRNLGILARESGIQTPAADFLDIFSEEACRERRL
jgi:hypothetical protein